MLTAFGPNPATMFLSWRGGAEASAPPREDNFREVFKGRLLARLASRDRVAQAAETRSGAAQSRRTNRYQPKKEEPGIAAVGPRESQQTAGVEGENRREEPPRIREREESQAARSGLAENTSQAVPESRETDKGAVPASPPQALKDLITFLQSLENGSLKIAPEQIPAVAAYLLSAGLPQEEVERLLLSPDFMKKGLSAFDLQAAWQRSQGQAAPAEKGAEAAVGVRQSQPGPDLSPETQEILQTPAYRARWNRAAVPESALPALRLALARLGCSPQDLARLEEEAQGQGLSLSRVWQILQQGQNRVSQPEAGQQSQPAPGENPATPSQSALLAERPVTGEEVAEWRQLLLKAGLKPGVVEKMLGEASPTTQEDLKTTLLALAPPDEPAPVLTEPKPLYLPDKLRLRPFFSQGQAEGDPSQMNGQGSGDQTFGSAAEWAANPGESFLLPGFTGELQMINPNLSGAAALSSTAPQWNPLAPEVRESLWSQLQSGIISNLQPGENQVSLRLNPPDMGQIQLTLNLNGQELAVTAVASRPEIAELAAQGVQQLLQALAQQGLILTQFQVRLQDQPQIFTSANQNGGRGKGGEAGERFSASPRQRRGEVDCFV